MRIIKICINFLCVLLQWLNFNYESSQLIFNCRRIKYILRVDRQGSEAMLCGQKVTVDQLSRQREGGDV